MNTDYEIVRSLTDKLNKNLVEYNGYGFAAGYMESLLLNTLFELNLNKKQMQIAKDILNRNINSVQKFLMPA
jgi:hypothetical protein